MRRILSKRRSIGFYEVSLIATQNAAGVAAEYTSKRRRVAGTRQRRIQRGSAVIEASLTILLFLMMVFALFDFGLSLYLHHSFVNQARAGARYGAINPDLDKVKNVVVYGSPTGGSGRGRNGLDPNSVAVVRQGTPTMATDRLVVTISGYHFTWITPGWSGDKTGNPIVVTMPVEY